MKPRPSTLAKDMLVILGGPGGFTTSMVALEPRKQKWSSLPSIPKPIVGCSISAFNNDIYVTGMQHLLSSNYRFYMIRRSFQALATPARNNFKL